MTTIRPGAPGSLSPPPRHTRHPTHRTRRRSLWSALVPVVALAAGVLFATSGTAAGGGELRTSARDIPDLIRAGTRTNAETAATIDNLQAEVDRLSQAAARNNAQLSELRDRGDDLAPAAGRTAVTGPVVRVELNDSPLKAADIPNGFTVDDVIVHQQDVQAVVNALWAGGAEAMMLMDQRVISTSAVRCVGNTLILHGRVYSPPYVITAMGNPVSLQASLNSDPTVTIYRQYVARLGLGYGVSTAKAATFPAFSGSISMQYAKATS